MLMDIAQAQTLGVLILLLPALGAVVAGALGPRLLKGASHWPVILGVGGAAVVALILLQRVASAGADALATPVIYEWFGARQGSWFNVELWIDPLTALMMAMVTFVATFVVIYSKEYMRHHDHPERGYERFFAFLGMFVFAMGVLVLGGNFLLLYLGWEAVGLCSYLLIGFYYEKPSAAAAEEGLSGQPHRRLRFRAGHPADLHDLRASRLSHGVRGDRTGPRAHAGGLASLLGLASAEADRADRYDSAAAADRRGAAASAGRWARAPSSRCYVWLPDAMEGPSPVSALIHAATMVTAGVYMMVRCG
jgi:NADH-quinone oxidoreductase subunit L